MNEQLKFLVELQKLDTEIINRNKTIQQIPKQLSASDNAFKGVQKRVEEAKTRLQDAEKKKREQELAVEENNDRISKLKERTASIKDNKAYNAHLKEIEAAENASRRIEDGILELMETLETRKAEVQKAEAALKDEEARINEEKKKLEAKVAEAKKELDEMFAGRAKYREPMDRELYEEYMELLKSKDGLAVAEVRDEVCSGCHMNIMPQLFVEIRKGEKIHYCPQCRRILYAEGPATPPASTDAAETSAAPE